MKIEKSKEFLKKGEKLIPALSQTFSKAHYSFVEGVYPIYALRGKGSHLIDVDNNEFIDYVLGLGPVSLGYCYETIDNAIKSQLENGISFSLPHTLEIEVSEKLQKIVPDAEMTRFSKTGSDAVTACIRAARAFTKKDHILYTGHGGVWHDWFTAITNRNDGVPNFNNDLISLFKYNDIESLKSAFNRLDGNVAAVVMEPMWLEYPLDGFLEEVQELTHKNNALLIFDEVLTGFRLANGGGQELLKVNADLVAFGKAIGNGMPLGAITGKAEYMKKFNEIFYSTTYGGETLSLAAGNAVLNEFLTKNVTKHCWDLGKSLKDGINNLAHEMGLPIEWRGLPVRGAITFSQIDQYTPKLLHSIFLQECIRNRVMFGPGETLLCYSHSKQDIEMTLKVCQNAFEKIKSGLQDQNLNKILEGNEIKTVMTF